jgi:hypothetical protein
MLPPDSLQEEDWMLELNKAEIVAELEAMVSTRLFGRGQWLTDHETACAVHQKLVNLGLVERVSDESDTWRNTALGNEMDVDLFGVFMGFFDVWDVPCILESRCLIDEMELDDIYERMDTKANPETVVIGYVKRAYLDYRNATKCLH